MNSQATWYIVKTDEGTCQIITDLGTLTPNNRSIWGPFTTQDQAIAARIGLIRSGKCQPQ